MAERCLECCNPECRGNWGTGCFCCHFNHKDGEPRRGLIWPRSFDSARHRLSLTILDTGNGKLALDWDAEYREDITAEQVLSLVNALRGWLEKTPRNI